MTVASLDQPLTNATPLIGQKPWSPRISLNRYPIAIIEKTEFHWKAVKATGTDAHVKAEPMLTSGPVAPLSADMCEYLAYEANRRGVEIAIVYAEELAAEERARQKALSREELKSIARNCAPDPRHLVADDDPF
jgi:hypothetical protein